MNDIYGNSMIGTIGIYNNRDYIGEIVSVDDWYNTYRVKVYIPELFPHFNKRNLIKTKEKYQIGEKIFNATTDIGIYAKQVMINREFMQPFVGDNVIVRFINGDIKKAVFYMCDYTYNPTEYTDWGDD